MSYIVKLFTFDLYPNYLSFNGTNIFMGCVTGDLFLQYVNENENENQNENENENQNENQNENKFKIKWCSAPYKETQKDIRKENYNLTNVAFFKETA